MRSREVPNSKKMFFNLLPKETLPIRLSPTQTSVECPSILTNNKAEDIMDRILNDPGRIGQ